MNKSSFFNHYNEVKTKNPGKTEKDYANLMNITKNSLYGRRRLYGIIKK